MQAETKAITRAPRDLVLTPKTLRRLDLIARQYGTVLQVRPPKEMGRAWGRTGGLVEGVYRDLKKPILTCFETTLIDIAPRLPVSTFWATRRPEIDWSAVPRDKVWEFLVWHEIGHLYDNFNFFGVFLAKDHLSEADRNERFKAVNCINEVLADRYAWAKICPDVSLPIGASRTVSADYVEQWMARLDTQLERIKRVPKPLPQARHQCIPWRHLKEGIPFENEAHREAARAEMIAWRSASLHSLLEDAKAAGVAIEYECDGGSLKLGWTPEMEARDQIRHRLQSESQLLDCYACAAIKDALPTSADTRGAANGQ